jgi:hypothetical protein
LGINGRHPDAARLLGVDHVRHGVGAMKNYIGPAIALLAFWLIVSFVFSWVP